LIERRSNLPFIATAATATSFRVKRERFGFERVTPLHECVTQQNALTKSGVHGGVRNGE
jgi:hypothetical protein